MLTLRPQCRRGQEGGLELRTAVHYPNSVRDQAGQVVTEPSAIEGFVHRIHGRKGMRRERLYLSTHSGDLFVTEPRNAHPPEPPLPANIAAETPAHLRLALLGSAYEQEHHQDVQHAKRGGGLSSYFLNLVRRSPEQDVSKTPNDIAKYDDEVIREGVVDRFLEHEKVRACELIDGARGYLDLRSVVAGANGDDNGSLTRARRQPRRRR